MSTRELAETFEYILQLLLELVLCYFNVSFTRCLFLPLPAVGLDAAGKTTILYKLKLGEIVTTIPTIGGSPDPVCRLLA